MKAKPKNSCNLSLIQGKAKNIHFSIGGDVILTVKEEPAKSLGRWYRVHLTDRHCVRKVHATATDGRKIIDRIDLPVKTKVWMFQHGLLPRLLASSDIRGGLPKSRGDPKAGEWIPSQVAWCSPILHYGVTPQ